MLNRRILRIKVFKTIYSYAENPGMTIKEAEAQLEESCESTRDLYLFLLSLVGPLTDEARNRIEAARSKFNPSEEEKNPNMKFVENGLASLLASDPDFSKIIKKKKFSWDQYDVLLRHLYEAVRDRDYFKAYIGDPDRSIKQDAELWSDIFANELQDNGELAEILEDSSIFWNDDVEYALNYCCKTFDSLGKGGRWALPELFNSDSKSSSSTKQSDRTFVVNVLRKAVANFDKYYQEVATRTPKWDKNRICTSDLCLIVAGQAEAEAFKDTPKKVIINEYVEISKFYSTPESKAFVNGLLDKIIN